MVGPNRFACMLAACSEPPLKIVVVVVVVVLGVVVVVGVVGVVVVEAGCFFSFVSCASILGAIKVRAVAVYSARLLSGH